jgi:hypothetical protein
MHYSGGIRSPICRFVNTAIEGSAGLNHSFLNGLPEATIRLLQYQLQIR